MKQTRGGELRYYRRKIGTVESTDEIGVIWTEIVGSR